MSKIGTIIKAQLSDKSNLGDWYTDRLEICSGCEFNSKNATSLTIKQTAMVALNFGKDTCLQCGCGIAAKATVEIEECGMVEKGLPSKWIKINIKAPKIMTVINESEEKVKMTEEGGVYELDYGDIVEGFDSEIKLTISKKGLNVNKTTVNSGCGCTVPAITTKSNGDLELSISYDTKRIGKFSKTISANIFEKTGKVTDLFFNIKGIVK